MIYYALVSFLQLFMSIFKVLEIKWSYENKIPHLTILTLLMSGVWLTSTSIGVSAILKGDIIMGLVYMISSALGKIVALKLTGGNTYRSKVFNKLFSSNDIQDDKK